MNLDLEGLQLKLAEGSLRVVSVILVFLIGRWIICILMRMFDRMLNKSARIEPGVRNFLRASVSAALYVLLASTILNWIGIPSASIAAALVSAGMAVGLALQGSLSNMAGGIVILFTRPFVTGDYIVIAGGEGFVTNIGLVYTKIRMFDNRVVSIPNSSLASSQVTNMTALPDRRIDIEVGISYESDIDQARQVILSYFLTRPEIWTEKPPAVGRSAGITAVSSHAPLTALYRSSWILTFSSLMLVCSFRFSARRSSGALAFYRVILV